MLDKYVEVLWVARYDYLPEWSLKEHQHEYYQAILIIDGNGEFILDGENCSVVSDKLFLMKPNQRHSMINKGCFLQVKIPHFFPYDIKTIDRLQSAVSIHLELQLFS